MRVTNRRSARREIVTTVLVAFMFSWHDRVGRTEEKPLSDLSVSSYATSSVGSLPNLIMTQVPIRPGMPPASASSERDALTLGSRVVRLVRNGDAWQVSELTPQFDSATLGDVSFDARSALVVARRAGDAQTSVWEIDIETGGGHRIVGPPYDCRSAIYLSTLFTIDADVPEPRIAFTVLDRISNEVVLYSARQDGSDPRRLTFAPGDAVDPRILPDGRLLFCHQRGGKKPDTSLSSSLMTVFPDGADLFPFAALHDPAALRVTPRVVDDGRVIYAERKVTGPWNIEPFGGSLVSVRVERSLTTRTVVAVGTDGAFRDAFSLSNAQLGASFLAERADASYALVLLDQVSGRPSATLYDDPDWHDIHAQALVPRLRPPGRSTVVNYEKKTGEFYCLDTQMTDRPMDRGTAYVCRVRVVERGSATGGPETILGEAKVERDGSFFIELPAHRAVRFETLDESGDVIQRMENWVWVMPGERRGCIGCHEDREMSPPNRHVKALRRAPERLINAPVTGLSGTATSHLNDD